MVGAQLRLARLGRDDDLPRVRPAGLLASAERPCGRCARAAAAGCGDRRSRAPRPGRRAAPGGPARSAGAARGSACAGRTPAARACSSRSRSAAASAVSVTPRWLRSRLQPRTDLGQHRRDLRLMSSIGDPRAGSRKRQHRLSSAAVDHGICRRMNELRRDRHRWRRSRPLGGARPDARAPPRPGDRLRDAAQRSLPRTCTGSSRVTGCRRRTSWRAGARRSSGTAATIVPDTVTAVVNEGSSGFARRAARRRPRPRAPAPGGDRASRRDPGHPRTLGIAGAATSCTARTATASRSAIASSPCSEARRRRPSTR